MKKNSKKHLKTIIAIVLTLAIAVGTVGVLYEKGIIANALFDPDDAVQYEVFKTSTTVDDSVLFIGTYIVHKDALTDAIYEKAMTSASDSGQDAIYYKSELSDGQWFDIGDIDNGLRGISTNGIPVAEEVIDPLYVTYYAGADGILKDAKSLAPVNPFDIPDPYDLSKLPELQPLWMQYTYSNSNKDVSQEDFLKNRNSEDSGNLRTDVYYYQLLATFFSLDLRDEETNKCDEQLKTLYECYITLKNQEANDEAELVYGLMDKVDAKRRRLVMERLNELDVNLLSTLYTLSSGSNYTPYGDFKDSSDDTGVENPDGIEYIDDLQDSLKHDSSVSNLAISFPWIKTFLTRMGVMGDTDDWWTVLEEYNDKEKKRAKEANADNDDYVENNTPGSFPFAPDSAILDAIGESMSNCSESYNTYMSKSLEDEDDVLGHAEYDYSVQVIESSSGAGLGGPVTLLKHVVNIRDNIIKDKAGELDLINSSLMGLADSKYSEAAFSPPAGEYASLSSQAAKDAALDDQKSDLESDRSTLQFLIDAVRQRDTAPNALEFVYSRIDRAEAIKESIPSSDFKPMATSSLEAHIVWLKEEAQRIIDSDESLKSQLDKLRERKEELQKKRDAALDDNDLAGAAQYDALIAAVDQDINDELARLGAGSGDGSDGSGSGSGSGSGAGGAGGSGSGAGGSGSGGADANMSSLADSLVDKAMDKLADNANADLSGIADALAAVGADDQLDALKNKAAASGASAGTLAGIQNAIDSMGDGSGGAGGASADELLAQLEALFGKSLDEMSDREIVIAASATSRLAKMGSETANTLLSTIMGRLRANNKYIYNQYSGSKSVEYVNLKTISEVTDYRYFYDEVKATATLTSGSNIKIFKRDSDQMYNKSEDSDPEAMSEAVVYSGELYLGDADSQRYFDCKAEYLNGTTKAACLTGPMQTQVESTVSSLSQFLGIGQ